MARVLIHSLTFEPDGVSTAYLYGDISKQLTKCGHEIIVLTSTPHYNILEASLKIQPLTKRALGFYYESKYDNNIKVLHIPMKKYIGIIARGFSFIKFHLFSLIVSLTIGKIDIVLSPSPPYTIGIVSWIIAKYKKAKSIYNVQEIYPDFVINQGIVKNKYLIILLEKVEKFIYKKSDLIITIDKKFSEIIVDRVVDKNKVIVIPNFVDANLYQDLPRLNEFSKEYNLNDKFVIAYAGNIGIAQNWEPIIYAAKQLEEMPIVFLIIGDGVKKNWLVNKIDENQLKNIILLPYQNRNKIPLINASADIHTIVMSDKSSIDGFPSKIYTIMACSRSAIVVTNLNSPLAKFMKSSNYGLIVDQNNNELYVKAIKQAYSNREFLKLDGENGRRFVMENYSKESIGKSYSNSIERLIKEKKKIII